MADNLCGPSNALKSFGEHAERDRSLQQDRSIFGSPQGGAAGFRSARPAGNGDEGFQSFLQGTGPALPVNAAQQPELAPHHLPYVRTNYRGRPTTGPTGHAAFLDPAMHAPEPPENKEVDAAAWRAQWAAGFAGPRLAAPVPQTLPAGYTNTPMYGGVGAAMPPPAMAQAGPFAAPVYMGAQGFQPSPYMGMGAQPGPAFAAQPAQMANNGLPPGLTEEALAAQFAQFSSEHDFQSEMDAFMAENTTADERANIKADEEDVEAEMERIADELDRQRLDNDPALALDEEREKQRVRDELSKTASEILQSVADNDSEKFANSSFFHLMRRITEQEVVLVGDEFVELENGQPIASAANQSQVGEQQAKAKAKGKAVDDGINDTSPGAH